MGSRGLCTQDLIRIYYYQMYNIQEKLKSNPTFGMLDAHVKYNREDSQVEVSVLRCENLIPLDVNGSSDPFVVIKLVPESVLDGLGKTQQTKVYKKTLNPIFDDDKFIFSVSFDTCKLNGIMVHFGVFDHDFVGYNDLEGEAVLPLSLVPGIATEDTRDQSKGVFRLALNNYSEEETKVFRKTESSENVKLRTERKYSNTFLCKTRYNFTTECEKSDFDSLSKNLSVMPMPILLKRSSFDKTAAMFIELRKKIEKTIDEDSVKKALNTSAFKN